MVGIIVGHHSFSLIVAGGDRWRSLLSHRHKDEVAIAVRRWRVGQRRLCRQLLEEAVLHGFCSMRRMRLHSRLARGFLEQGGGRPEACQALLTRWA